MVIFRRGGLRLKRLNLRGTQGIRRFLLLTSLSVFCGCASAATDLKAILDHVDELWRGNASHTSMTMTVSTKHYNRNMTLEGWSLGEEKALVVIKAPKKDKGIATLKSDENVWNFLPKINRVTKVPASMMSGSWMGSHFTNDDLVKESALSDDYDRSLTFEGERKGNNVYEVTLIPHDDAPVVWGKVIVTIEQETFVPIEILYFDEDFSLKRTMTFGDNKKVGNKIIPHTLTLVPMDKPDESTVIRYQTIDFSVQINERFFSLQNLKNKRS